MDSINQNLCSNAVLAITQADVSTWQGLPQPCQLSNLKQQFKQRRGEGIGSIGQIQAPFLMFEVEGFNQPIRVWVEEDTVLIIDMKAIELSSNLSSILATLGEPEVKLDSYIGTSLIEQGEWVYPNRGIALFMHPQSQRLDHITLFPATTLIDYEAKYRLHLRTRRLPQRR